MVDVNCSYCNLSVVLRQKQNGCRVYLTARICNKLTRDCQSCCTLDMCDGRSMSGDLTLSVRRKAHFSLLFLLMFFVFTHFPDRGMLRQYTAPDVLNCGMVSSSGLYSKLKLRFLFNLVWRVAFC